jgi:hypothetical protein
MFNGEYDNLGNGKPEMFKTVRERETESLIRGGDCQYPKKIGLFRLPYFSGPNWAHPCDMMDPSYARANMPVPMTINWFQSIYLACQQRAGLLDCVDYEPKKEKKVSPLDLEKKRKKVRERIAKRQALKAAQYEDLPSADVMVFGAGAGFGRKRGINGEARVPATKPSRIFSQMLVFGKGDAALLERKKQLITETAGAGVISKPATSKFVTGSGFISR